MKRGVLNRFNRGEVSPLALARDDVTTIADSCELMDNFIPERLGPMRYRPGTEYIGDAYDPTSSLNRALIPLTRSISDSVMFEFSGTTMRPLVDGLPITVSSATISFTNEAFTANITGWTTGGAAWSASHGGSAALTNGDTIYQSSGAVTAGVLQTFYVTVFEGPVYIRVGDGAALGLKDLFDGTLFPGEQFIQFTPQTTQFTISFLSVMSDYGDGKPTTFIGECVGKTSGNIEFTVVDLDHRTTSYDVSGDVLFIALGADNKPKSMRRIGSGTPEKAAYTYEDYLFLNGPYDSVNPTDIGAESTLRTTNTAITTDANLFTSNEVGRLFKIIYPEHTVTDSFTSVVASSETVGVRGSGTDREMLVTISGTFVGTVELKRYDDKTASWVTIKTYTSPYSDIITDKFDEVLIYYRFECTAYTSGTAKAEINYVSTRASGHGLITAYNSATSVDLNAYSSFIYTSASVTPSIYWSFGSWYTGAYPQGVTIYEGRVCWASKNRIDMTVTDDYYNFDREIEGNSAAIQRTIGFGPVDDIAWLESSDRLYIGLPTTEVLVRSTNFDEPLTYLNTNLKPGKGVGSKAVRAVPADDSIYFVSRDGVKLNELNTLIATDKNVTTDLMLYHPAICEDGIAAIVVSKHPEQRIWVLTETGELRVLLKDPTEGIQAWSRVTVDGVIEDICVIPASGEDELWMIVRRNGNSQIEKLSKFSVIEPMDAFKRYASPGTATLTGLSHLEGESVGVWADSEDRGSYTVTGGQIVIDSASYASVIVGLRYTADYKSNKLGQYVANSVIGERKRVQSTALVMKDYSPGALRVGADFTTMRDLPGATTGTLITDYDEQPFGFPGRCDTDSRICLRATGPCTIMALSYNMNEADTKSETKDG